MSVEFITKILSLDGKLSLMGSFKVVKNKRKTLNLLSEVTIFDSQLTIFDKNVGSDRQLMTTAATTSV